MKRMPRILLAALAAATLVTSATRAAVDPKTFDPRSLPTPPLGRIPAVTPERVQFANGAVVYLLEDHALPTVRGIAYFPSSPTLVPSDRVGLAGLTGQVMRNGGSAAHSGDGIDDRLAAIGASLSTSVGGTQASTGFRCLSENTAEVVGLWAELTRRPAFPDDKIELAKVALRQSIASRNDEMMSMLMRVAGQAVYGKDSPWARQPEYATVEPIAASDCRTLHAAVFVPERMVLAVYGDFKSADMKKLLAATWGDWTRSTTAKPVLPPKPTSVKPHLYYAPKEDVTQSGVIVAQPGSLASDPDYAALQVLEQGLGGGFASRMFSYIRTARGLAYATGANAGSGFDTPGVMLAYSLTKSESTMVALQLVRDQLRAVTQGPLNAQEMATAKQATQNSYVFNFEDPSQSLFRAAYYESIGYPADFLQRYQKSLDAVTADDVLAAAKRKITPDAQVAILVGRVKDFDAPLASAGLPVDTIDIRIPPPPSKMGKVTVSADSRAKARGWLEAAVKAAGGAAAWQNIKSMTSAADVTLSLQGQSISMNMEQTQAFPYRQVVTQKLPFGEVKQGFDGKNGWVSAMGQLQDNPKAAEEAKQEYTSSIFNVFANPGTIDLVALDAPETIEGVEYRAAALQGSTKQDHVLLFSADGKLAGEAYQDKGNAQMGPARVVELRSDWRALEAVQYPYNVRLLRDGKPFMEAKVTAIKLNPAVTDDMFAKPAK
jgi:zinc protease